MAASMVQTFYVTDNYINTTIYDDSIVIPTEPILPKRLQVLQACFTGKGLANKILDFNSTTLAKSTYGLDMEDLAKYGQGGLNIIHGMQGGCAAQICRLLPDNAEIGTLLVSVEVTPKNDIPIYERLPNGKYKWENGSKIPIMENGTPVTGTGCQIRLVVGPGDPATTNDEKPANVQYTPVAQIPNPSHATWVTERAAALAGWITTNPEPVFQETGFETETQPEFDSRHGVWETNKDTYMANWDNANPEPPATIADPTTPRVPISGQIPLFKVKYYGPGKCGNDFGIRLVNDYERDNQVGDGRRYALEFYSKDLLGNDVTYGQSVYFAMNPEAEIVKGTGTFENLRVMYQNINDAGTEKEIQISPSVMDNFDILMKILSHLTKKRPTRNGSRAATTEGSVGCIPFWVLRRFKTSEAIETVVCS